MGVDEKELYNFDESSYGSSYKDHLLKMYDLYVNMADNISARRQSANSYFLSINTAVVALVGYVKLGRTEPASSIFYMLISLAGMILTYTWYRLIRSYKNMNTGKFQVIHLIEKQLPISPYDAEWSALGRGRDPDIYLPFTKVEMRVPWIFFAIHLCVFIIAFISGLF